MGDKSWQKMAGKIMAKFVNAQTKFFDSDDYDGAVAWAAACIRPTFGRRSWASKRKILKMAAQSDPTSEVAV